MCGKAGLFVLLQVPKGIGGPEHQIRGTGPYNLFVMVSEPLCFDNPAEEISLTIFTHRPTLYSTESCQVAGSLLTSSAILNWIHRDFLQAPSTSQCQLACGVIRLSVSNASIPA